MKRIRYAVCCLLAAIVMIPAAVSRAFEYTLSVDQIAADPLTAYQTVYLGMPRADFDANFTVLPDWKFLDSSQDCEEIAERSTGSGSSDVTEGIRVVTANASPTGKVLAFDNYFKTKDKKIAKSIYTRLVATIYSNMENFPQSQRDAVVVWVENDVTIVVSYTGRKDAQGYYTVTIHRYNNRVLHE